MRSRRKEYRWYNLIRQKIDIYAQFLSQKLSLPIWLVLSIGHSEEGNVLNTLPHGILVLIFKLFQTDICETAIANTLKLDVFKKIYTILAKHNSKVEASQQLLDINAERSPEELFSIIERDLCHDGSSLIAKAWQLTLMHYDNFSSKNDYLVQALTMWAVLTMVWKLDRLGRDLRHLVNTVHDLTTKEIGFKVLTRHGAAIDTTTAAGKLVFGIFAALAEFEREMIKERTLAGIASARAKGRKGGRPYKMTQAKLRLAMVSLGQYISSFQCKETVIQPHYCPGSAPFIYLANEW